MVDALFEALGFKRIATMDNNVIKPVAFEQDTNQFIECDTCGDYHRKNHVPKTCETGDGE